jgi:dTDP-4-amino-4,6-dideoxygalactose transaminase
LAEPPRKAPFESPRQALTLPIACCNLKRINDAYSAEIHQAVRRVIDSGRYILGDEVKRFEAHYAAFIGTKHCIGGGNGYDALRLILKAYIIKGVLHEGDEVLVPANTFMATILAITANRLVPVLVEPDDETLEIDIKLIPLQITPRSKALIIVHLYGRNSYSDRIGSICSKYGLILIEDNAQAAGCWYDPHQDELFLDPDHKPTHRFLRNALLFDTKRQRRQWQRYVRRHFNLKTDGWEVVASYPEPEPIVRKPMRTGSIGHAAGHSFYPTKNLGALGDGGAVTTNDDELADIIRALRHYGSDRPNYFTYPGSNSRLDEMQAAILDVKLNYLDASNQKRIENALYYYHHLFNPAVHLPGIEYAFRYVEGHVFNRPKHAPTDYSPSDYPFHVFHLFPVFAPYRDLLADYLKEKGIETQIHYPIPPHQQPAFPLDHNNWFPVSERLHLQELSLPMGPDLQPEELEYIVQTINEWLPNPRYSSLRKVYRRR